jgi:hypothetical protein
VIALIDLALNKAACLKCLAMVESHIFLKLIYEKDYLEGVAQLN